MQIDLGTHSLRIQQRGNGPPHFICLHGLVDTLEVWNTLAAPLADRGHVVALDQRAHGGSTAPPGPYAREDLAADVIATLDHVRVAETIVVAHSMGGIVAMTTALAFPDRVRGLVLLGAASQCNERVAMWYERIATAAESDGLPGLARAIYGNAETPELRGDAQGLAHVTRCLKSLHTHPLTPRLGAIRCPTLLVVGERDPMGPAASAIIAKQISGATLVTLPNVGHWVHVEAAEALLGVLDPFLAALPP